MTKTTKLPKIILDAETIMVPLDKLDASPENVRRTMRDADIESLAANIADDGLLQNLGVTASINADGEPTGRYEVAAGERRRRALLLLVKQKRLAKNAPIPCRAVPRESAVSASLSENVQRVAMHPADEYEAFAQLHAGGHGLTVAQIAGRHGVSEHTVKQRLRLGTASPRLLVAFRGGTLTLAQLMAFCVTDDQAAQERVFDTLAHGDAGRLYEHQIRRALLEDKVPLHDRRMSAIGVAAYEAAGGTIERDLFSEHGDGWATDVELLNRLATEKLEAVAEAERVRGWAWVVATPALPTDLCSYRRKAPERVPLSPEDEARLSELAEQFDLIDDESGGEPTDEQAAELERIEAEMQAIQSRQDHYSLEVRAEAGVFVTLGHDGIEVMRGWVRPSDHRPEPGRDEDRQDEDATGPDENHAEATKNRPALSAALTDELLAHRTAALQIEVARRPDLALRVLLHALILDAQHQGYAAPCKISVREPQLRAACPTIDEAPARKELAGLAGIVAGWKLPEDGALLPWLVSRGTDEVLEMLAVLVAHGIDAGRADWTTAKGAGDSAAQVARLADLDMRQWWQPTAESYFGRVSKGLTLEAVREGAGDENARRLESGKKADIAAAATVLLDGKGWLPTLLRHAPAEDKAAEAA